MSDNRNLVEQYDSARNVRREIAIELKHMDPEDLPLKISLVLLEILTLLNVAINMINIHLLEVKRMMTLYIKYF